MYSIKTSQLPDTTKKTGDIIIVQDCKTKKISTDLFQAKEDFDLKTKAKTIAAAINEIKSEIDIELLDGGTF